ncbi:hypothetical protein F2P56_008568 [Juglans regia]|uniref:Reverse transcriptase domain-containing protein n=1 Tax=Juglans regia TaxID=51240 RepID=A0A834D1X2_JUGRE|nr:hypothetical protein F2P56_008568 [Juglans regia]
MMRKMRLNDKWIKLLMLCVDSVSYSVLINGRLGEKFSPSIRLRQENPLPPYLFVLCAEGLSSLLSRSEPYVGIRSVATSKGGTEINHLLFADYCVIFRRATQADWKRIQEILHQYEVPSGSGQVLNKQKTSIVFSSNTSEEDQIQILQDAETIVCGYYSVW